MVNAQESFSLVSITFVMAISRSEFACSCPRAAANTDGLTFPTTQDYLGGRWSNQRRWTDDLDRLPPQQPRHNLGGSCWRWSLAERRRRTALAIFMARSGNVEHRSTGHRP